MNDQGSFSFMPDPKTTFDPRWAKRAKTYGMDLAAASRPTLLDLAREAMVRLAASRQTREVDADDIAHWLIDHGHNPADLGPATPSVFRGEMWVWTGRWRKSLRVSNHSRVNRIWRLR